MVSNFIIKCAALFLLLLFFGPLSGCAPALFVLGTMGSGASKTSEYISHNKVARSVTHELDSVKKATLIALGRMGISVEMVEEIEGGEEIYAKASDRAIVVELKKLTPSLTHIEITAKTGPLFRDKATAEEIVEQSVLVLEKFDAQVESKDKLALSIF